jgi:predicted transcriptional regulator
MIEGLTQADIDLLNVLIRSRYGKTSFKLAREVGKSQTYTIYRLSILNDRGILVRSKQGRSVVWAIRDKLRKPVSVTLNIGRGELKDIEKQIAETETDDYFKTVERGLK